MYKRALVPLDGSMVAETIIPLILEIAGPLDMEVVLLRVVQPTPPVVIEGTRHIEVEDVEARRLDAQEYLASLAAELRDKGVRVGTRVRRGLPSEEIAAAAGEEGADLIAMSTHGHRFLQDLLRGSTADRVRHGVSIPVLMVRAK